MECKQFLQSTCNNTCKKASQCIQSIDARSSIVCEENKKKYVLENPQNIHIGCFHIDGGVIVSSETKKCDYLLATVKNTDNKIILVELKGVNFETAIEQLDSTITLFASVLANKKIFARVVGGQVPQIRNSANAVKLQKKVMLTGGNLVVKSTTLIENEAKLV